MQALHTATKREEDTNSGEFLHTACHKDVGDKDDPPQTSTRSLLTEVPPSTMLVSGELNQSLNSWCDENTEAKERTCTTVVLYEQCQEHYHFRENPEKTPQRRCAQSGIRKCIRDHSSMTEFCKGVPVNSRRLLVLKRTRVWGTQGRVRLPICSTTTRPSATDSRTSQRWERKFLMLWASSRIK